MNARGAAGMNWRPLDLSAGLIAAAAGLLAMAGTAAVGLLLLDAGKIGDYPAMTAAVVALAVGGSADLTAVPAAGLPVAVHGNVHLMPLGVSLAGAVVLGAVLLYRGRDGLLVRSATAVLAFVVGVATVSLLAHGTATLQLPAGAASAGPVARTSAPNVEARFSVAVGPTLLGAAAFVLAVAGVCWLIMRWRLTAGSRVALWTVGGLTGVGVLAASVFGGPQLAGCVVLALPVVVFGALLRGLGVPWTVSTEGVLPAGLDSSQLHYPTGLLIGLSSAVLLGLAIAVAVRTSGRSGSALRRAMVLAGQIAPVAGAVLTLMTLLARVSVEIGITAFVFSQPVLEAQLTANPLIALAAGLAGGAVAGFAASLLVDGIRGRGSLSWPIWN